MARSAGRAGIERRRPLQSTDDASDAGDVNDGPNLELEFDGEVIYWRGPSPFHFVAMPDDPSSAVRGIANAVSYGWGCIPVRARIGDTTFTTALFPKDGRYLVPLKDAVRRPLDVTEGDVVRVELAIGS
jgi:Domain of unknown function (DUF1905)